MCVGPSTTGNSRGGNAPALASEPSALPALSNPSVTLHGTGLDAQDGGPEVDIVDRLNAQTKVR